MANEIVTTILAAPPNYDLVDLSVVRSELKIDESDTSSDVWLSRGVTQISRIIARYCNRVFQVQSLQDLVYFERFYRSAKVPFSTVCQLSRWPIVSMTSAIVDFGLNTQQTLVLGTDYSIRTVAGAGGIGTNAGELLRLDTSSTPSLPTRWVSSTLTAQYTAGYGSVVTEPFTIAGSPYQYTVKNAMDADGDFEIFSIDLGVTYAVGGAALTPMPVGTSLVAGQYISENGSGSTTAGRYTFASADTGKAVNITYAYNQIPDDLVDAVLKAMTQRYKGRDRDPMLLSTTQPGIGDQRWLVGAGKGSDEPFTAEIMALIDPYRVPVFG